MLISDGQSRTIKKVKGSTFAFGLNWFQSEDVFSDNINNILEV
jgi:hypothetical protein